MMTKNGVKIKDTDNKNISSYRFHASVRLSQATGGVGKSVYSTGLRQLFVLLFFFFVDLAGFLGKVRHKSKSAGQAQNIQTIYGSIDKYTLHCLLVSSEHISLVHSHKLKWGHKRRCFGAKWRRSSPRLSPERLGVPTTWSFQPGNFGLVKEADMERADIRWAWKTKVCIHHQGPRNCGRLIVKS